MGTDPGLSRVKSMLSRVVSHHLPYLQEPRDGPGVAQVQHSVPGRPAGGRGGDDGVRHAVHKLLGINKVLTRVKLQQEARFRYRQSHPSQGNRINRETSGEGFQSKSPET